MIYTVTLNPAIDHIIESDKNFQINLTNYYSNEYKVIGGKGINVSIILNNLQADNMCLGILGKENKDIFLNKFKEMNLKNKFFINDGNTRTNYKIKDLVNKTETELNGTGFEVNEKLINELRTFLEINLKKNDILILTGSIPAGLSSEIYFKLGEIANNKKSKLIVDASGDNLLNALKAKPYLIKPNVEEICKTLSIEFKENISLDELEPLVKSLKEMGAINVLVSMGSKGSIFFDSSNNIYKVGIAQGKLVNSVGSGDSMIGGFSYGIYNKMSAEETLKLSAACGGATAFNKWIAPKNEIEKLITSINVEKIK